MIQIKSCDKLTSPTYIKRVNSANDTMLVIKNKKQIILKYLNSHKKKMCAL